MTAISKLTARYYDPRTELWLTCTTGFGDHLLSLASLTQSFPPAQVANLAGPETAFYDINGEALWAQPGRDGSCEEEGAGQARSRAHGSDHGVSAANGWADVAGAGTERSCGFDMFFSMHAAWACGRVWSAFAPTMACRMLAVQACMDGWRHVYFLHVSL